MAHNYEWYGVPRPLIWGATTTTEDGYSTKKKKKKRGESNVISVFRQGDNGGKRQQNSGKYAEVQSASGNGSRNNDIDDNTGKRSSEEGTIGLETSML